MNAPLKAIEEHRRSLEATMREIGREARQGGAHLALAPAAQKNEALAAMAKAIRGSPADPRRQCGRSGRGEVRRRDARRSSIGFRSTPHASMRRRPDSM